MSNAARNSRRSRDVLTPPRDHRPRSRRRLVQDGRIHIEKINAPFLFKLKASGPEFGAGIKMAVERGWLEMHESGTFVRQLKTEAAN